MQQILLIIHVLVCIGIIGFVLIQQGKGAQAGAAFGSGASQTVFGAQGSGSFLTRTTAILATLFFVTSLGLGYLSTHAAKPTALQDLIQEQSPAIQSAPARDLPSVPKE